MNTEQMNIIDIKRIIYKDWDKATRKIEKCRSRLNFLQKQCKHDSGYEKNSDGNETTFYCSLCDKIL